VLKYYGIPVHRLSRAISDVGAASCVDCFSIKFCTQLENYPTEKREILRTAYRSKSLAKTFQWRKSLKQTEKLWTKTLAVDNKKHLELVTEVRNLLARERHVTIIMMAA